MFCCLGRDASERSVFCTTYNRRKPADKGKRKEKGVAVSMTSSPARKIRNMRYPPFLIYWVSAVTYEIWFVAPCWKQKGTKSEVDVNVRYALCSKFSRNLNFSTLVVWRGCNFCFGQYCGFQVVCWCFLCIIVQSVLLEETWWSMLVSRDIFEQIICLLKVRMFHVMRKLAAWVLL